MQSEVSIEINNYKSDIRSVDLEKLSTAIENFNKTLNVFNIPNHENHLLLDIDRINTFINNGNKLPADLGNIVLSSPHSFFSSNLPKIDLPRLHKTKWVFVYKGDIYKEHKILYIPFIKEDLNELKKSALKNKRTLEAEILNQSEQEVKLRNQQNNPDNLKLLLTELITNKRKLIICLKNLIYLTKIELSEKPEDSDLLDTLEAFENDIKKINVMLFESLPK